MFELWEKSSRPVKTYYVDQNHPKTSDGNPGTENAPFRTISRAARILKAGERVRVASGIYREKIVPLRGGKAPDMMVSYEAAPGACVIVKGSEILKTEWVGKPLKP